MVVIRADSTASTTRKCQCCDNGLVDETDWTGATHERACSDCGGTGKVYYMLQLILHLVGDYITQSQWMANGKTQHSWIAAVHATVYALPFALIVWPSTQTAPSGPAPIGTLPCAVPSVPVIIIRLFLR